MTIPGMWGVEHYGRRSLLIYGAAWMTICEFLVAIIGVTISTENHSGQQALIALVCLYIAGFASTWGPIAWVLVGEIFPLNIRAKAMSLSVASNWLWNFALAYATPYLVNPGPGNANLGVKVFFLWGSTCLCCTIFAFLCVPEVRFLTFNLNDSSLTSSHHLTDQGSVARADRLALPELLCHWLYQVPPGAPCPERPRFRPQGRTRRPRLCGEGIRSTQNLFLTITWPVSVASLLEVPLS